MTPKSAQELYEKQLEDAFWELCPNFLKSGQDNFVPDRNMKGVYVNGCLAGAKYLRANPPPETLALVEAMKNVYPPRILSTARNESEWIGHLKTWNGYLQNIYWKDIDSLITKALADFEKGKSDT